MGVSCCKAAARSSRKAAAQRAPVILSEAKNLAFVQAEQRDSSLRSE
jgi:hypothetical protein